MRRIVLMLAMAISTLSWGVNGNLGNGDGSQGNPYRIEDLADFNAFCGTSGYWDNVTRLECDLDLFAAGTYARAPIAGDPIDDQNYDGTQFAGTFDGNNHIIRNLTINNTTSVSRHFLGLFGYLGKSAKVKNLGLENVHVSGKAFLNIGGLIGKNCGFVENCYSTGSVTSTPSALYIGGLVGMNYEGDITNCFSTADVIGERLNISGGLVGENYCGSIDNCYSTGVVNGYSNSSNIGGLVGSDYYGSITNSYSTGSVNGHQFVGGLVGDGSYGNISCNYSTGNISGYSDVGGLMGQTYYGAVTSCYSIGHAVSDHDVGGLVGEMINSSIQNSYSTGPVSGVGTFGGLVGYSDDGIIQNSFWDVDTSGIGSSGSNNYGAAGKTTAQMQTQSTFTDAGWDFIGETTHGITQTWQMPTEGGYPVLSKLNGYIPLTLSGLGSETEPYLISSAAELGAIYHYSSKAWYKLTADIHLAGIPWSAAVIPVLGGCLDGDGHVIDNLNIEGGGYLGLFGRVNVGGKIKNLGLKNSNIIAVGYYAGGLAGGNFGSVEGCYSSGSVSGNQYVGGLLGIHHGGSVRSSYSIGNINGTSYVGGLVGIIDYASVQNCYSICTVSGSLYLAGLVANNYHGSVISSYSAGNFGGSGNRAGLVAYNTLGSVLKSFWDVNTSGVGSSGSNNFGAIGKTTVEMKTLSTFTSAAWDFTSVWAICAGTNYPRFQWQIPAGDFACPNGVGIEDLNYFIGEWLLNNCTSGNNYCCGADIDASGAVDLGDYAILAQHWLKGD